MRVLVCGGRDYLARQELYSVLDELHEQRGIDSVVQGGAKGADKFACDWGRNNKLPVLEFAANWTRDGRAAGPIRNQNMLNQSKPDLVVAFPGGRGTAHMVGIAKKAGVEVIEVTGDRTTFPKTDRVEGKNFVD